MRQQVGSWDSRCRMGYQVTSLVTRCARGSFCRTPKHTNLPQKRTEGTHACSGVSIFDSRAHSETTKGFNGKTRTLIGTLEREHLGRDLAREAAEGYRALLHAERLQGFQ